MPKQKGPPVHYTEEVGLNWKQFSGKVKAQWGKLTDDELAKINGNREELEGRLQSHCGYAKDKAKAEVDAWCART